jgi:hypothetical protein
LKQGLPNTTTKNVQIRFTEQRRAASAIESHLKAINARTETDGEVGLRSFYLLGSGMPLPAYLAGL